MISINELTVLVAMGGILLCSRNLTCAVFQADVPGPYGFSD